MIPNYDPTPAGVLVADCPWPFGDSLPGPGRGAASHYSTLSMFDLQRFTLPPLLPDSLLFLWVVESMQEEGLRVCRAWGFTPKTSGVWIKKTPNGKRHFGMGRTLRAEHERFIVASRGRPEILSKSVRSVFEAAVGEHSAKPEEFYALVERLSAGPYAELFARRHRRGWFCYGDEVDGRKGEDGKEQKEVVGGGMRELQGSDHLDQDGSDGEPDAG